MANDGPWCQTAFSSQIVAELREYLVLRGDRRQRRRRDRAHVAQHRQPPLQRRPVARLNGLLPGSVPEVALDHAFIEIGQLRAASCDPTQEIADQVEAPPCAVANEPLLDEARGVKLDELVRAAHSSDAGKAGFCSSTPLQSSSSPPLLSAEREDELCRVAYIQITRNAGENRSVRHSSAGGINRLMPRAA